MLTRRGMLVGGVCGAGAAVAASRLRAPAHGETFAFVQTDAEWHRRLTADQYAVLRQAATERPFTSPLLAEHRHGLFSCAGCDQNLFSSDTKFESGTGWPSFWAPLDGAVGTEQDNSFFMVRTAVHCSRCGGHLGHVFDDGPQPTGLRYCMNVNAMPFMQ
jgi:peptide-methionine (R)-S-oxide reductase